MSANVVRKARSVGGRCAEALYLFALAAHGDEVAAGRVPAARYTAENGYDTFAARVEGARPGDRKKKPGKRPFSISGYAKAALFLFYERLVFEVSAGLRPGSDPRTRLVYGTAQRYKTRLAVGDAARSLDVPQRLSCAKFVRARSATYTVRDVERANVATTVFVRFLKGIARLVALRLAEGTVTLNQKTFRIILRALADEVTHTGQVFALLDRDIAWATRACAVTRSQVRQHQEHIDRLVAAVRDARATPGATPVPTPSVSAMTSAITSAATSPCASGDEENDEEGDEEDDEENDEEGDEEDEEGDEEGDEEDDEEGDGEDDEEDDGLEEDVEEEFPDPGVFGLPDGE